MMTMLKFQEGGKCLPFPVPMAMSQGTTYTAYLISHKPSVPFNYRTMRTHLNDCLRDCASVRNIHAYFLTFISTQFIIQYNNYIF